MKAAGLWDVFVKHSRPEGEEAILADKTGARLFHHAPEPDAARPEIDRSTLRQILLDGVPQGSIKWGHAFVSAAPVAGSAEWELKFANGFKTVVDLLVGADGARSRVRPLVSDAQIQYTGITGAEVSFAREVAEKHPELIARIGNGSMYALDEGKLLGSQRNGDGRVRTYAWFHSDEPDVLPSDPSEAIAFILAQYEGWAPWLRQLVELADRNAIYPRPLHILPVGHSWPHRAGVTLLGDAMNLLTPYGGRGANVAMYAAWQLGLALANGPVQDLDAAVAKYEQDVRKVVVAAQELSDRSTKKAMGPNGAQATIDLYHEQFAADAAAAAAQ
ncbi:FAD/NAD(P)-binding domain-containing protein [Exidia glandulosa HHB12029]|uniref:FAD/NAD(P)-binding domain-containing protein n=1 Tax=Exidia glandulosa HHB12029 TaxID=1314781 RepID=A0A165G6I9_EXIGL|nr:FAD/NAD(P)-binding domain-containing protein [Exidia glandulosa HHB12029]